MKKRAPKRRKITENRDVICASKNWYATEHEAHEAADRGMLDHMDVNLDIYRCDICGHWHLTQVNKAS